MARQNGYEIEALGLGNRQGAGILFSGSQKEANLDTLLPGMNRVALDTLLAEVKGGKIGLWRRIKRRIRGALREAKPSQGFSQSIQWLQERNSNVLVFALLRKTQDAAFKAPIQGLYAGAIEDSTIQSVYVAEETAHV